MTQQRETKPGPEPLSEKLAGLAAFFEAYERDGVIFEPEAAKAFASVLNAMIPKAQQLEFAQLEMDSLAQISARLIVDANDSVKAGIAALEAGLRETDLTALFAQLQPPQPEPNVVIWPVVPRPVPASAEGRP